MHDDICTSRKGMTHQIPAKCRRTQHSNHLLCCTHARMPLAQIAWQPCVHPPPHRPPFSHFPFTLPIITIFDASIRGSMEQCNQTGPLDHDLLTGAVMQPMDSQASPSYLDLDVLLLVAQLNALGCTDLLLNQVHPCHHLCHGMLHLQTICLSPDQGEGCKEF